MAFHLVQHPLISHKMSKLRDKNTTVKDFRELLEEIGMVLAVESTRDLPLIEETIDTPLETTKGSFIEGKKLVLVPILRAGLGLLEGFLSVVPNARVGHIGIFRNEETLQPNLYYFKLPAQPELRTVYLIDPMLATGGSALYAIDQIKKAGVKKIKAIFAVASPEGVAAVEKEHPDIEMYAAALDRTLNEKGYILPGLGDAGDRFFGTH
ncbi:MAG: uracil phosphoribosyltransferase [Leptospiraceae bacterium]|nr:uracil phosphoribosyltransferase [Leptospiraceae bacterium]